MIRSAATGPREFAEMEWGFPPPLAASRPVTNVRNLTSLFWRTALSRPDRRCLVPVTAFSERTAEPDPAMAHNELVGAIHPKAMPMILAPHECAAWLTGDFAAVYAMSDAYPDDEMRIIPG